MSARPLENTLELYMPVLNNFPALVWRAGLDATCFYFNQTWLDFTGRTLAQEMGDGWVEGVHPNDRERCVSDYLTAFHARRAFTLEYRLRHHTGEYRWLLDFGTPIINSAGEFVGFVGACYDTTAQKRAEQATLESQARYRAAQEELVRQNRELATLNAIVTAINQSSDLRETLQAALDRVVNALDLENGSIVLLDANEPIVTHGSRVQLDTTLAAQVAATGQPMWSDMTKFVPLRAQDQSVGVMMLSSTHLLSEREDEFLLSIGQHLGVAIAQARLAEQTREIQVLREMDRLRAEWIANVSHELRTPLGLIKLFTTALLHQSLDPTEHKDFLNDIDEETDKLTHIVDNLLDLSRLQSGRLHLERHAIELGELTQTIVGRLRTHTPHHTIELDFPNTLIALADTRRIEQVLRNLLSNAVKYSPEGGIITVRGRKGNGQAIIQVNDEGIGIPAHDLEKIFERFYRVRDARTQSVDGVGVGLAVCRGIVQAHDGEIWAESVPGHGSTFTFTLPSNDSAR